MGQRRLFGKMPTVPIPLVFIGNFLELDTEKFYDSISKAVLGREKVWVWSTPGVPENPRLKPNWVRTQP